MEYDCINKFDRTTRVDQTTSKKQQELLTVQQQELLVPTRAENL